MAWNFRLTGSSPNIIAALPGLVVSTSGPAENAQVTAIKQVLTNNLPASGTVDVKAVGSVTAANKFRMAVEVEPITIT